MAVKVFVEDDADDSVKDHLEDDRKADIEHRVHRCVMGGSLLCDRYVVIDVDEIASCVRHAHDDGRDHRIDDENRQH